MLLKHFLLALLLLPLSAMAQRGLWADDLHEPAASQQRAARTFRAYRPIAVRLSALRSALRGALTAEPAFEGTGPRGSARAELLLALPRPEGGTERFRVQQVAVLDPALAARFPQIKTYQAQSLDHPGTVARLDVSPAGFHAQVLTSGGRSYYLDPASIGDTVHHRVFYQTDRSGASTTWHCGVLGSGARPGGAREQAGGEPVVLRTFRLAVACTPEYALVKGNTVASALAAIVTSVNRVDGVYERELAVRLVLVANNDRLVFLKGTGPQPDPAYSNNSGDAMLEQNQLNVDRIIGPAGYDIGHVFSTGGGGIAYTPSACDNAHKAGGVTGAADPSGDDFDIDYVAHEIGHQLGAYHTFNSTQGFCGGGNRTPESAYEPGGGTTIMAYAGICSPEDVQPHSDPYFHSVSYDEIRAYIDGSATCGSTTATANRQPLPVAGPAHFIPCSTPFVLTGGATDPDADALTYSWEEDDRGPATAIASPSGDDPLFRVFAPVASPTRYFPRLDDLIANIPTLGEQLPTYARRLHFRLVVRDNRAGGGGLAYDSTSLAVVAGTGPFVVSAPNTGSERWQAGTRPLVSWDVAGTAAAPISAATVDILLSLDGGHTYPIVLAAATPNDGTENVRLPLELPPTTQARIMVRATGNVFFDISNADFTIVPPPPGLSIFPNPSAEPFTVLLVNDQRGTVQLRVHDALGRLVRELSVPKTEKVLLYSLDLSRESRGLYLLQLTEPDGAISRVRLLKN